jgi:hypothetical protein
MKTKFLLLAGMALCMLASCGHDATETPLTGSLVKIEKQDSKTKQTLLGVKDQKTGTVVVKPRAYKDITADENLIICTEDDGIKLFLPEGILTGSPLITFQREKDGYYIGTADNDTKLHYYFPEKKTWIRAEVTFFTPDLLILQAETEWIVVKPNGERVWEFPLETASLLEREADSKYEVAITPEPTRKVRHPSTTVYSITGDSITIYTEDKWKKQIKSAQRDSVAASTVLRFSKSQAITPVKNIP